MRINPNQQPLWRNPFEMQIGTGANAVALGKLSAAQERLIAALYKGIADQQLPAVTAQLGLSKAETNSVLAAVDEFILAEPPALDKKIKLADDFIAGAFAEIIRGSLLHSVDGEQVLIGRAGRSVHIEDLGRAGLQIALGLAAAGIGQLISHDDQKVDSGNLGPTGYPSQLAGHPRVDALRSILAASPNKAMVSTGKKISTSKLQKVDCAVLISQQVTQPQKYASWMNNDIPHIAVTFDADGVSVSPMIIPGQSACLFCLEKMRTVKDENWPVIATQLIASNKRFDDAASQLFAAGIVVQKILARADRVAGFELTEENLSGFNLELKTGKVTEYNWPQQSQCECVANQ